MRRKEMPNADKNSILGPIGPIASNADETLVIDGRDGLSSGEMIQNRLWEMENKLPDLREELTDDSAGRRPAQGT
jgi:hypothetical protein